MGSNPLIQTTNGIFNQLGKLKGFWGGSSSSQAKQEEQ
jgi:hypothetical protein